MSIKGIAKPISINIADENELATIAEIGIQRAKSIIEYRARHGKIQSIDELKTIAGFDQSIIENIRQSIII